MYFVGMLCEVLAIGIAGYAVVQWRRTDTRRVRGRCDSGRAEGQAGGRFVPD